MHSIQGRIRTILYSFFAVIIGIILIRLLLKAVGANTANEFTSFWYNFSDIFVEPWAVIYTSVASGKYILEIYSVIAMLFYMIIAGILTYSATAAFEDTRKEAIIRIVDAFFKAAEFLLVSRFLFKLTDASTTASFVRFIYDFSAVVYEPFANILPATQIGEVTIEISTIVALIIIIILDLITEQLLASILDALLPSGKPKSSSQNYPSQMRSQTPQAQPPLQPAQNININIPQTPPNQYFDQRAVNVRPTAEISKPPQRRGFLSRPKPRSSRQGGPANS
ncbi:YggT family protein [Candidatus Dojkabacteria bacterium]|nr:YggT family protein [Candidatus Dojkabacteria bacterium]